MRPGTRLLLATVLPLSLAGLASAWRTDVAGTPSPSRPLDVTTLADGTVVAVGRITVGEAQDDAAVVALEAATGAELWRHVVAGTNTTANDVYRRVVPGTGGTVVAGGRVLDLETGADALVSRFAGDDGTPVWDHVRDGGEGLTDEVNDVAVLGSGDVVAVGRLESGIGFGSFAVWRLEAATGNVLWTRHLDAPGGIGRRVVLSGDAAYVAGETDATGTNDDVLVARVAVADGAVVWTRTIAGDAGADDDAIGIAFAGGEVTVLANVVQTATGPDGLVVNLSAGSGNERWRALLDGAATGDADDDAFSALALAPDGDAIVAGTVANPVTDDDLVVARLDTALDGAVDWRTEVDGGNEANDEGRALAVATLGAENAAFVTGRLREPGQRGAIGTLRFDAATGAVVWQHVVPASSDRNDLGLAIAVDAEGDVVVAGRARRDDTGDEFAVVKLSGASGGSFPCGNALPDPGEDCDDGNPTLGDGCRPDCTIEVCGDGILDPNEDCDEPGNPCCAEGCVFPPPDTACDDGDACTQVDLCIAGACTGTDPVVCPVPGQCETGGCDPVSGTCVTTPRPDASTCSDGNACTRTDQCQQGVCVSGVPEVCDDFEPCTVNGCDPEVGCTFSAFTGVAGVACAVDQGRIDQQCGTTVPRTIRRRIAKTTRLLDKAEIASGPKRVRRLLGKVAKTARKAGRKSARLGARNRLPFACADTLVDVFADVEARVLATQPPALGSGS